MEGHTNASNSGESGSNETVSSYLNTTAIVVFLLADRGKNGVDRLTVILLYSPDYISTEI